MNNKQVQSDLKTNKVFHLNKEKDYLLNKLYNNQFEN
jgi:hypothetical protein